MSSHPWAIHLSNMRKTTAGEKKCWALGDGTGDIWVHRGCFCDRQETLIYSGEHFCLRVSQQQSTFLKWL